MEQPAAARAKRFSLRRSASTNKEKAEHHTFHNRRDNSTNKATIQQTIQQTIQAIIKQLLINNSNNHKITKNERKIKRWSSWYQT